MAEIGETWSQIKKGGWFQKIPHEVIFSPGGFILMLFAGIIEIIDFLIPIPIVDNIVELPLELIFLALLSLIAHLPWQSMIVPFIIERMPLVSDILPTWFLKMFL